MGKYTATFMSLGFAIGTWGALLVKKHPKASLFGCASYALLHWNTVCESAGMLIELIK